MSAQINASVLKNFIVKTIGADKLTLKAAQEYKIDKNSFNEANKDENNYLELDEILDDTALYEKFATLLVGDLEKQEKPCYIRLYFPGGNRKKRFGGIQNGKT